MAEITLFYEIFQLGGYRGLINDLLKGKEWKIEITFNNDDDCFVEFKTNYDILNQVSESFITTSFEKLLQYLERTYKP